MTYNPLKPDPGPSPALDAPIMQTNFSQFGTIFAQNHGAMNTAAQGSHTGVVMTLQAADPNPTQDLVALYCKNAPSKAGTQPQLFIQIPKFLPNEVPNTPMQLTYNSVNTAGPVYQSFLLGGYLLFFGQVSAAGTVTLSPAPTKILIAIASPTNPSALTLTNVATVSTNITSNSTFDIFTGLTGSFNISWMAVCSP